MNSCFLGNKTELFGTSESQNCIEKTLYIDDDMEQINSDQINKAIGVDCAEIIKNITLGSGELDF